MKNVKKKYLIYLGVVLLAAVVVLFFIGNVPLPRKINGIKQLDFKVGDKISGYSITNEKGEDIDIADIYTSSGLIIFAMDGCGDCEKDLPNYGAIYNLFNSEEFFVKFIWDNKIPQEKLDDLGIPQNASYTANGKYKFTNWVPNYYFVDESGSILDITVEISEAVEKLPVNKVATEGFNRFTNNSKLLVGIEGCSSCKKEYEKLINNDEKFIYWVQGPVSDSYILESNQFVDEYRILSKAFGIETYPALISVSSDGELITKY